MHGRAAMLVPETPMTARPSLEDQKRPAATRRAAAACRAQDLRHAALRHWQLAAGAREAPCGCRAVAEYACRRLALR
jgi:hypothetical protein